MEDTHFQFNNDDNSIESTLEEMKLKEGNFVIFKIKDIKNIRERNFIIIGKEIEPIEDLNFKKFKKIKAKSILTRMDKEVEIFLQNKEKNKSSSPKNDNKRKRQVEEQVMEEVVEEEEEEEEEE